MANTVGESNSSISKWNIVTNQLGKHEFFRGKIDFPCA